MRLIYIVRVAKTLQRPEENISTFSLSAYEILILLLSKTIKWHWQLVDLVTSSPPYLVTSYKPRDLDPDLMTSWPRDLL